MEVVTEKIMYADFVRPVRLGLRWLAVYFAIVLPLPAVLMKFEDFILVAAVLVFPGSLLPFISPWSRARELARKTKTIAIDRETVTVDGESHNLSRCRWFRGFAFHDPQLGVYRAGIPAIVVAWPPYGEVDRTVCGLSPDTETSVVALLEQEAIPEDLPRLSNERFLLNATTIAGAALVVCLMAAVNQFAVPTIPLASITISAGVGGIAARIWLKHRFGHFQFQGDVSKTLAAWVGVIVVGTLRINRRNRGVPMWVHPALFVWVLPLALVQGVCLFSLYRYVRTREDDLLATTNHPQASFSQSVDVAQIAALYEARARLKRGSFRWGVISLMFACGFVTMPFLIFARVVPQSTTVIWIVMLGVPSLIARCISSRADAKLSAQQCPNCGKPLLWKSKALTCQNCDEVFENPLEREIEAVR